VRREILWSEDIGSAWRRSVSFAAGIGAALWLLGCAGSTATLRPLEPPWPSPKAVAEFEAVCHPGPEGCRPTRLVVIPCVDAETLGCEVHDGLEGFFGEWEAYHRYIRALRQDP
jgi:hypothetical protein